MLNFTLTVTDCPGASELTPEMVINGKPANVPVAVATVTPFAREVKRISNGPLIGVGPMFVIVIVPLNVLLTRL